MFEIVIAILVPIIILYLFALRKGLTTRCPGCGVVGRHKVDWAAEKRAEESAKFAETFPDLAAAMRGPSAGEKNHGVSNFICNSCGEEFDFERAAIWQTMANKAGDAKAIEFYRESQQRARGGPRQ